MALVVTLTAAWTLLSFVLAVLVGRTLAVLGVSPSAR
jgi:hypothetical protein